MTPPGTALVLEDDECDAAILRELLENCCSQSFSVRRAAFLKEAMRLLSRETFEFALVDMDVPDSSDLNTVREVIRANPAVPVIVLTGNDDIDTAIKALEIGAQDYLPKSQLDNRTLQRVIEYSVQRKQKEAELSIKAYFDTLTGLANRSLLYERWRRCLARSKRADCQTGVLVADIDRFRQTNDRFGHAAGDALLKDFAMKLSASVRETDVVARLGGDEFVIVLETIKSKSEIDDVRDALLGCMKNSFLFDGREIAYTASIGGAISAPKDDEDLMAVIRRADAEVYEFRTRLAACEQPRVKQRVH